MGPRDVSLDGSAHVRRGDRLRRRTPQKGEGQRELLAQELENAAHAVLAPGC
jgi:hypothetical protein